MFLFFVCQLYFQIATFSCEKKSHNFHVFEACLRGMYFRLMECVPYKSRDQFTNICTKKSEEKCENIY